MDRCGENLWARFALLWLAGISLRITVLAVPPILPEIHRDLRLNEAAVGALTSLPILLLALASVPGSLLIARLGARRALLTGLLLVAFGGAARGVGTSAVVLFTMTLIMGAGIAVSQPALPSLVRLWLPAQIGRATAVFTNGLLVGEVLGVALTGSVIMTLVGARWQYAIAVASIPVVATAAAVLVGSEHVARMPHSPPMEWWPDWRGGLTWRLGLILGCASITYFGAIAFIPDYLRSIHHGSLITPALTVLNVAQIPASFVVAAVPHRLIARRWPMVAMGLLTLLSLGGFLAPGVWNLVAVGALGFAPGMIFILSLALPPILSRPNDAHRLSAAMFTIAYSCSFLGSLLGGVFWDRSHQAFTAFLPISGAGIAMIVLATGLDFRHGDVLARA